ncbi:MAG: AMP-binding protein, partial [Thermoplasmataceae archaeon]
MENPVGENREIQPSRDFLSIFGDQAKKYQSRPVMIFQGRHLTYHSANVYSSSLAFNLNSVLGLEKGDRVLIALPWSPQLVISILAVLKVGAVPAFMDHRATSEQIRLYASMEKFKGVIVPMESETMIDTGHSLSFVILSRMRDFLPFEGFISHSIKKPLLRRMVSGNIEVMDFSEAIYDTHEYKPDEVVSDNLSMMYPGVDANDSLRFVPINLSMLVRRSVAIADRLQTKAYAPRIASSIESWTPEGTIFNFIVPVLIGGSSIVTYEKSPSYLLRMASIFQAEMLLMTPPELYKLFIRG